MKGQVFTMDLVLGTIIILSIISSAYVVSSAYSTATRSTLSNSNLVSEYSSAVAAFTLVNATMPQIFAFQNGGSLSTVTNYIKSTLGAELATPYSVSVYALEDYSQGSGGVPNVSLFSFNSSGFSGLNFQAYNEPILVTNTSSLCGTSCNVSLIANSTFPSLTTEVNAAGCSVFTDSGASVSGWTVQNNTPAGYCTITVAPYNSGGKPGNYLVSTTNGTVSEGKTTLYVLGLDLIRIEVQT